MLSNREIDLLLEVSDYLSNKESKVFIATLSNVELDKECKAFAEALQEARGRGTPPPRHSEILRDFDRKISENEAAFFVYRRCGSRLEYVNHIIADKEQAKRAWKNGKLTLEEYESAYSNSSGFNLGLRLELKG